MEHQNQEKTDKQQDIKMKKITARKVFTGKEWLGPVEILVENEIIQSIQFIPDNEVKDFPNGFLCPAFIDLQVYGGNGILFSNHQTVEAIQATYDEHSKSGTEFFQITLNCSPKESIFKAIDAAKQYQQEGRPGLLGLHLEGPFFNPIRRGAHKEEFVQKPSKALIDEIIQSAGDLRIYMTIAPEMFDGDLLDYIIQSPIICSIGHSDATKSQVEHAFKKGINKITHLFNAQSQWQSRALGIAGTSLLHDEIWASIIVDGLHLDYGTVRLAKELKKSRLFLITDAVTEDISGPYHFSKKNGKFSNDQGTLSGSALTMHEAIENCVKHVSIDLEEAIRMGSLYPAEVIGLENELGTLEVGKRWSAYHWID